MAKERKKDDFIKAPRNIVRAQDLTSTEKVLLLLLIDKYRTMKAFDRLQENGSFYITGAELEACMDIKKRQILDKHIPSLERKGFINKISRPEDKEGSLKTYCFFTLNIGKILNHQGDQKDAAVQAKRVAKCEKMRQTMEKAAEETATTTEPQPQKPFSIDDLFLSDFDEDEATRDIRYHPEMYDAGLQWSDFQ